MVKASVFEAKTQLSELLKRAQQGETVVITSGRERVPVARLEPIEPVTKKRLGALETPEFKLPVDFFEPLPDDELRIWNEGGE
jgi:prevent-host-death family protein